MPTFDIEVPSFKYEFEVFCSECGNGLCRETEVTQSSWGGSAKIEVKPCSICLDEHAEKMMEGT